MKDEPHIIVYSPKENLRQVLCNYREFTKSIDAFVKSWGEDENIRNRPERQKLCAELCQFAPNGIKLGEILTKIERATGIEID